MSETTLIANGTIVTAEGEFAGDVLIDGETIIAVGRVDAPDGARVIDATDCFVLPGLIDNHTHLSMPFMGMMSSDDYNTGTQAAAPAASRAWSASPSSVSRTRCNRRSRSGRDGPTAPRTSTMGFTWRSPTPASRCSTT